MAPEAWLLTWFCVTTMNPACMKWDGVTEQVVTSFNSEAECVSYATKIARKVHTSFNFDLKRHSRLASLANTAAKSTVSRSERGRSMFGIW